MIPDAATKAAIEAAKKVFDGKPPRGTRAAITAALEAAAPHMLAGMEWGVFRASDDEPGTPIENRRYKSRESAQRMIDQGYNPSNIWEVRGRTVGEWAK